MKCPNCGAECNSNSCKLCGTVFNFGKYSIYKKFISLLYNKFINFFVPISSIILIVVMGLIATHGTINNRPITFSEWIILMIILLIVIVLPFDTVRWFTWGKKKYANRLLKRIEVYKKTEYLINKANELAEKINKTTDRDVFEKSLSELKSTYKTMIRYEKYGVYESSTPRQDLNELLAKEQYVRKAFENRLIDAEFTYTSSEHNKSHVNYDSMEGHDFEHFCADILRKNGFINVEVTQGSGDHGIDILAEKDDISYAIQCKCYSSNIGNAAVQQSHTGKSLYKKNVAVVLTNRYFTAQAKEEAQQLGVKLWDRDKLNELIEKANITI